MGKIWRGILFCLLLCGVMTTASGCGGLNFTLNPQELYSLPKLPSKYDALNTLLGEIIGGGAEYASPTSGTGYETEAIMSVVIGGTALAGGSGSGLRTVLGVLLIILLSNCMNMLGISTYMQTVMKGVILVTAIWLDNRKEQQIR